MQIDSATFGPGGILKVKCSGKYGIGSEGNPSAVLRMRTIKSWIADHPDKPVAEIEVDYTDVDYSWGDGPVSSMVTFLGQGITKVRIVASSSNCDSLRSLLEGCNLPFFELIRIDGSKAEQI